MEIELYNEKLISQQKVNYETKISELQENINSLEERREEAKTDEILIQKLEYWKEKANKETARIENLEKQIIEYGDANFMSKIFN